MNSSSIIKIRITTVLILIMNLFQKSVAESRGMSVQSFFDPFSCHLWLSILIAYVMVSVFMFVIARVTPYERHASKEGRRGNSLTLANSFWFTLSAFFFRSTPISPKVS